MAREPKFGYDHVTKEGTRVMDLGVEYEELWVAPIDKGKWRAFWVLHPADGRKKGRTQVAREYHSGQMLTAGSQENATEILRQMADASSLWPHTMLDRDAGEYGVVVEQLGPLVVGVDLIGPQPRGLPT